MKSFFEMSAAFQITLGLLAVLLLFTSVSIVILTIRSRQWRNLWAGVPVLVIGYLMVQFISAIREARDFPPEVAAMVNGFGNLPGAAVLGLFVLLVVLQAVLFRRIWVYENSRITPGSIKEATDSLPAGLGYYYSESGGVVLTNRQMEELSRIITGKPLIHGGWFFENLLRGPLQPGCERVSQAEESALIRLPEGPVWSFERECMPYGRTSVSMITALDVSREFHQAEQLQEIREEILDLNRRLAAQNQDIVGLTAEEERLNAKVRIHDELGANLLAIRRYLAEPGDEALREELLERLRRNISFLNSTRENLVADEYRLMIETAEKLGVWVRIDGELPQEEPLKHILASGIHECLTNTLRHAGGDELSLKIRREGGRVTAVFTNNGLQPTEEIQEKGGLVSLRELVEKSGGKMTVRSLPEYSITLELPGEVQDEL